MSLPTTNKTDNKSNLVKVSVVNIISIGITQVIIIIRIAGLIIIIITHTKIYCAIYIGGIIKNKILIKNKFLC
jgi:hypothetical protein